MHACMHTLYGRAQMHNWILDYNMARLTLCKTIWICVVGEFQVVHKTPQLQMLDSKSIGYLTTHSCRGIPGIGSLSVRCRPPQRPKRAALFRVLAEKS